LTARKLLMSKEKYTPKLRQRILERDDGECQFPMYDEKRGWRKCGSKVNPECHHIKSQRFSEVTGDAEVNNSDNLIILGKRHHQSTIHDDMPACLDDYGRQKRKGVQRPDSFDRMFNEREAKAKEGEKYWNTDYDRHFADVAHERSHLIEERSGVLYIAGKRQK